VKRGIRSNDYEGTAPPIKDPRQVNRWGVCVEGYELMPPRRGSAHDTRLRAKYALRLTDIDDKNWKTYKPLEEHPDLFLRFARLGREPVSPQRALSWCERYGVLGLAGDYHWGWAGENKACQTYEHLDAFDAELDRAAGILSLYEAVLNRDEEAARYYAVEKYPQISEELYGASCGQQWDASLVEEMVGTWGEGDHLVYALEAVTFIVESTVRGSCYPTLRSEGSRDPSSVSGSWGFKNLRGAMYLQMYWLMASGGNVRRCRYCGAIIALSRSLPEGRKPRQDRKYCNDACRQRYHYHNTTKLRRQAIKGS
jgi:hypothetical protein